MAGNGHGCLFLVVDVEHLFDVAMTVRTITEKHLEKDYTTGPYIDFATIDVSVEDLRCHVQRRT